MLQKKTLYTNNKQRRRKVEMIEINLNDVKRWQIEVLTNIVDEGLHVDLVSCSVFLVDRVAFTFEPQHRFDLAAILALLHAFLGPLHHVLVQFLPTRPLLHGGAAHGAGDQTQLAHHHAPPQQRVREDHAGAHAASLSGVNVDVEGLVRGFPLEGGGEAEDGWIGAALRRNHAVPPLTVVSVPDNPATTGHVALT